MRLASGCKLSRRAFLAGAPLLPLGMKAAAPAARPNVILILSDDQGYGDLSLHGNPHLSTPNLDGLAKSGVEFTRFYVSPVCAPTRASLMTGRYAIRTNVHGVTGGRETMRAEEVTIAGTLKSAGYRTALFGKWHLGEHYPYVPHARGFDEYIGFRTGHWNNYWDSEVERNGKPLKLKGFITDALTDQAIRFMDAKGPDPFFIYLAYNVPHVPLQAPEKYWSHFKNSGLEQEAAAIYSMVASLDDNIGRLLAHLDRTGLADNTVVIFLSDNGPLHTRYNCGLRGNKGSVYEGGNRSPFFLRWPKRVPAGVKVDKIAAHIDVYPTLLSLCGVAKPAGADLDGKDLTPLLSGKSAAWPDRMLFTIKQSPTENVPMYPGTVRTQRFNLVDGKELYDIGEDPGEKRNLAADHPEVVKRLRTAYEEWFHAAVPTGSFRRFPIPVGYAEEDPVVLPAAQAAFGGQLRFHNTVNGFAHDWITNWISEKDAVRWQIDVVRPGRFAVSARYLCAAGSTGSRVEVQHGGQTIGAIVRQATPMEPKPSRDLVNSGPFRDMHWAELPLGEINLARGAGQLEVRVPSIASGPALDLQDLILKRIE